jgi:hypothetical protein
MFAKNVEGGHILYVQYLLKEAISDLCLAQNLLLVGCPPGFRLKRKDAKKLQT